MKKVLFSTLCILSFFATAQAAAQQDLSAIMPLLQASTRTAAQNQQVLALFSSAKDPSTVFAAGASLVRIPPTAVQENKLLNIIIKDNDMLKKVFAAVILTSMGSMHEELSGLLQDAISSQDHAVRSYAAGAYTILNPKTTAYADEIINLYIYDPAFAQRAMNLLAKDEKETFKYIKKSTQSDDPQVRAAAAQWLGELQNEDAAKLLLKMAKTELNQQTASAVASALAKNSQWTLQSVAKGLKTRYTAQPAATYALALGFMTGRAVDIIKQGLLDENENIRINSARAAAYMAGVLTSPDASLYTQDRAFDIALLKSVIAPLTALEKKDNSSVKVYAGNALKQIARLM